MRRAEGGRRAVIATGGSHGVDLVVALALASRADFVLGFATGYAGPIAACGI